MRHRLPLLLFFASFIGLTLVAPSVHATSALAKPPNNLGLVGYWPMNEGTSTQAGDYSGQRNTGQLRTTGLGLPAWTSGRFGGGLSFSPDEAQVAAGTSDTYNFGGTAAFTVSFWQKTTGLIDSTPFVRRYPWRIQTGGNLAEFCESNCVDGNTPLDDGKWHLVTITHTGTTVAFYLDGAPDGTQTVTNLAGSSGEDLLFGADDYAAPGAWLSDATTAALDEVRIYNRVLSATEVAALYARGTAGAVRANASSKILQAGTSLANGLTGLWTFDGADVAWTSPTAGTARNGSGNGRGLPLAGMTRTTSPVIGRMGQGLFFDGAGAALMSASNLSSFITASDATLALWVKPTGTPGGAQFLITDNIFEDISIKRDDASNFSFNNWDGAAYDTVTVPYTNNEWVHLVLVHTSGTLYAYKNGNFAGSVASGNTTNLGDPLILGASNSTAFFNGSMDEVRTYSRGLSAAEVKQLYLLGAAKIRP